MEKELTLVSYTNKDMFFRKIPKKGAGSQVLDDWKVTRDEINQIIMNLNKTSYKTMEEFRDFENKDFLGGYVKFNNMIFLPVLLFSAILYIVMNYKSDNAR